MYHIIVLTTKFKMYNLLNQIYSLQKVKYDSARKLDDELRKLNFLPWTLGDIVICFEFLSLSTTYLIQVSPYIFFKYYNSKLLIILFNLVFIVHVVLFFIIIKIVLI